MVSKEKWDGDTFDRKKYADFLTGVLLEEKSFVLNIDSSWGSGKTFFLRHWYEDVKKSHPSIFFNAWKTDFSKDPFVAITSCISESLLEYLPEEERAKGRKRIYNIAGRIFTKTLPTVIKGASTHFIGDEGTDALFHFNAEDEKSIANFSEGLAKAILTKHDITQTGMNEFKIVIKSLINEIKENKEVDIPLFVFVDELDRCRPTYAIELLENIKHLFDIDDVIFIIATDTGQLASSVKAIYGDEFSSDIYLKRFFDRSYTLPDPDYSQFAKYLIEKHGYDQAAKFWVPLNHQNEGIEAFQTLFAMLSEAFKLKLRDQEQCFARFHALKSTFQQGELIHVFLLTFLIMYHHQHGHQKLVEYISSPSGGFPSSITLNVEGERLSTQKIINVYMKLYNLETKEVYNECRSQDHLTRSLSNIIVQQSLDEKRTNYLTNILKKYPDLVRLAGSIH